MRGDRKAETLTLCTLAHLEAMAGEFERAHELYPPARTTLEEFGSRRFAALTALESRTRSSGAVELLAGDPEAAERQLRPAHERLRIMGERSSPR